MNLDFEVQGASKELSPDLSNTMPSLCRFLTYPKKCFIFKLPVDA